MLVVTLLAQYTVKLLQQLKSGFEPWLSDLKPKQKIVNQEQSQYFD